MQKPMTTVQRHILEQERAYPQASGDLTGLLWDLTMAAKVISHQVNRGGLADIFGETGDANTTGYGDLVRRLDRIAQDTIYRAMDHGGHLCVMVSEESPDMIPIPAKFPKEVTYCCTIRWTGLPTSTRTLVLGPFSRCTGAFPAWETGHWRIVCARARSRWRLDISFTVRARCSFTPPGRACTDLPWTRASENSFALTRRHSHAAHGEILQRQRGQHRRMG